MGYFESKQKKVESLRELFADDRIAINYFNKICMENRKSLKKHKIILFIFIIAVILILFSIIFSQKILLEIGMIAYIIALACPFLTSKKVITTDELKYLNAVLKERSFIKKGEIPAIKKGDEWFSEEDGKLIHIGSVNLFPIVYSLDKYSYLEIEDYKFIVIPRFRVNERLSFERQKIEKIARIK